MSDLDEVMRWEPAQVAEWVGQQGFAEFADAFIDNDISGDILFELTHDVLKELNVKSVGKRVGLLKAVKRLGDELGFGREGSMKTADSEQFSPSGELVLSEELSELLASPTTATASELVHLESSLRDKDAVISQLRDQLADVRKNLQIIREEFLKQANDDKSKSRKSSWARMKPKGGEGKDAGREGKEAREGKERDKGKEAAAVHHHHPAAAATSAATSAASAAAAASGVTAAVAGGAPNRDLAGSPSGKPDKSKPKLIKFMTKKEAPAPRPSIRKGVIRVYGEPRHEGEMYRTIAVTLEDQVQNILPIALKKFGIMEPWQDYTLSVRFRTAERCLRYDECPLAVLKRLRGTDTPTFGLYNIRTLSKAERDSLPRSNRSAQSFEEDARGNAQSTPAEEAPAATRAVVIYQYDAQLPDEMTIAIGDEVTVNKRATGWWFVVRGDVAGWAPSSCLDLLNAPSQQDDVVGRTGTVLYDYVASGANELTIRLGDKVLVHSKHQHWLLAESDGRRGWVPSCYVTTGEPDSSLAARAGMPSDDTDLDGGLADDSAVDSDVDELERDVAEGRRSEEDPSSTSEEALNVEMSSSSTTSVAPEEDLHPPPMTASPEEQQHSIPFPTVEVEQEPKDDDAAPIDPIQRQSILREIQHNRQSVHRLSVMISQMPEALLSQFSIPPSGTPDLGDAPALSLASTARQNVQNLLLEIDADLALFKERAFEATTAASLRATMNIQDRISQMVRDIEFMEKQCIDVTPNPAASAERRASQPAVLPDNTRVERIGHESAALVATPADVSEPLVAQIEDWVEELPKEAPKEAPMPKEEPQEAAQPQRLSNSWELVPPTTASSNAAAATTIAAAAATTPAEVVSLPDSPASEAGSQPGFLEGAVVLPPPLPMTSSTLAATTSSATSLPSVPHHAPWTFASLPPPPPPIVRPSESHAVVQEPPKTAVVEVPAPTSAAVPVKSPSSDGLAVLGGESATAARRPPPVIARKPSSDQLVAQSATVARPAPTPAPAPAAASSLPASTASASSAPAPSNGGLFGPRVVRSPGRPPAAKPTQSQKTAEEDELTARMRKIAAKNIVD